MRFDYTAVKNFRNFTGSELKTQWAPGINLILGRNGAGKTNLLEALSILTGWGAFTKTSGVISWSGENLRASAWGHVSGEESFDISAEISSRISLRLNTKSISFTDLRLAVPSVIFLTGNLNLIDGSPSSRRLFIDRLCSLFIPPYAKRLAVFKDIHRARSAMLRQGKSPVRTDSAYCDSGGWIMDKRRETLRELMRIIPPGKFMMEFLPALKVSGNEYLREVIAVNRQREIYAQRVLYGPGYDELAIRVAENGRPASEALSRGQKRKLILYIIITAGKLIAQRLKREPILLFDDLTAELDSEGREWVYRELTKTKWQTFITAPEKPFATRKKFGGIDFGK